MNLLQFLIFFQFWKINIAPSAQLIITQSRKLALFEFLDTTFFTDWIKGLLGMEVEEELDEDFCDVEVEDCSDDQLDALRRYL